MLIIFKVNKIYFVKNINYILIKSFFYFLVLPKTGEKLFVHRDREGFTSEIIFEKERKVKRFRKKQTILELYERSGDVTSN